jgi:hypothetical protein
VVGVRDAHLRLSLRAISRSEFTLKRVETCVTRTVVVLADPPKSVFATLLPKKPVQLNHVEPRVTKTRLSACATRFIVWCCAPLSAASSRSSQRPRLASRHRRRRARANALVRHAALLRRHAAILSQLAAADDDAFEAVRIFRDFALWSWNC